MKISVINSGSEGNGYVLDCNGDLLLIECGVRAKEMLKAINYQTLNVAACIVSHNHMDHIGYLKEYSRYGFPIYVSEETYGFALNAFKGLISPIKRLAYRNIGQWQIKPFKVPHSEAECDGFLIRHPECGSLLFITDAEMCPYDFSNLCVTHVMVECNYAAKYMNPDAPNKDHVYKGHMELQTTKRFVKSVYHPGLMSVGLIHLSNNHADSMEFAKEIQCECPGTYVWVARRGTSIELNGGIE